MVDKDVFEVIGGARAGGTPAANLAALADRNREFLEVQENLEAEARAATEKALRSLEEVSAILAATAGRPAGDFLALLPGALPQRHGSHSFPGDPGKLH